MDFNGFDHPGDLGFGALETSVGKGVTRSVKVMIAGGFGTGKTTMVRSVSDIKPLTTEETLTEATAGVDHLIGVTDKTETTVSLDFGKIGINDELVLYLFGTPGQERFWFLWNGLFKGALGAVVLVDTRRLASSFRAIEEMERQNVPFVIALNVFPDSPEFPVDEIRDALDISADIPVVAFDARERSSSRDVLVALIRHLKERSAVVALESR
ncbi:GTP-binding protein [Streptomyces sp. NPDC050528]|uniref:GTP-binding protein n=1 Tax=unclassified Streptomyces TaxID=2593676 RepID=UPI00379B54DC